MRCDKINDMKNFHNLLRILIGLFFVMVAASKFGLAPSAVNSPEMFTPEGWAFIQAVSASGYIFPVIAIVSLLSGLAFVFNRYVAIAAIVLVPITLNFAIFHIFLGFSIDSIFSFLFIREAISYVPLAMVVYILYRERARFYSLLK